MYNGGSRRPEDLDTKLRFTLRPRVAAEEFLSILNSDKSKTTVDRVEDYGWLSFARMYAHWPFASKPRDHGNRHFCTSLTRAWKTCVPSAQEYTRKEICRDFKRMNRRTRARRQVAEVTTCRIETSKPKGPVKASTSLPAKFCSSIS